MKSKKTQRFLSYERLRLSWFEGVILSFWALFGSWFYLHAMQWREDGWYFGHGNVWSDWSLHVSQVTRFVVAPPSEWWTTSTYYAGGHYTYPFVSNLLSGLFVRLGLSYPAAMIGPSLLFWFATLATLFWFGRWMLGSGKQAVVAMTIFFCSAGFGLLRVLDSLSWREAFLAPTRDYTQFVEYQWGTGNLFLGMFLPQRAFLLGFWIALFAWGMWLRGMEMSWGKRALWWSTGAGILAGILPIIHMHSFMAVALLSAPVALRFSQQKWRQSLVFGGVTALISVPLYFMFVAGGIENPEFFQINLFWTTDTFGDWIVQWVWQWGLALPVAAHALWLLRGKLSEVRWWALLSFSGVFVIANLIQFQPTAWDNTKLFLWVYWGVSVLLAWYVASLWCRMGWPRFASVVLFIALIATGAHELLRSSQIEKYTYQATSRESYELALRVREGVPLNAVFATAPTHNHWVTMWTGRPIVLGYTAWVWNFGFLYQEREKDMEQLFTNAAVRDELLDKYNVDYIVVGPDEMRQYGISAVDFMEYPVAFESPQATVFSTSQD
jgi:hypothetical protein